MEDALITNRELASLILIGLFLVGFLMTSNGRSGAWSFLKSLIHPKISIPLLLYAGWILLALLPAKSTGLWEPELWKPTILWMALSGLGLFFGVPDALKDRAHFRTAIVRVRNLSRVGCVVF